MQAETRTITIDGHCHVLPPGARVRWHPRGYLITAPGATARLICLSGAAQEQKGNDDGNATESR